MTSDSKMKKEPVHPPGNKKSHMRWFKKKTFRKDKSLFLRVLDGIERVGNSLPHPVSLFAIFVIIVMIVSDVVARLNITAVHPGSGERIQALSLLTAEGLRWFYTHLVSNFVLFPPLGVVLVVLLAIGVAEGTGLISAMLRHLVLTAPKRLITSAVVAAGILSHMASSAGYVLLVPLGAMIFVAVKRHPIAGIAAAFAGVSGGFGANFIIGAIDPVLAGLSESAAHLVDTTIRVTPAVNFYFALTSSFVLIVVGTWVTEKIVEPRLGEYHGEQKDTMDEVSASDRRGLIWAAISTLIVLVVFLAMLLPQNGLLRDPDTGSILHSPFMTGLVSALFVFFIVPGIAYGIVVGTIKNDKDVVKQMTNAMKGLGGYIVLVFFAAQFVYCFRHSNMGVLLAIKGAELLKSIGFTGIGLLITFVIVSAFINLFMGSASAKWAIMAPVFVPMFMLLGYHPGITQAAYRIGDSITNIITPMMSFFALIVAFAQKYHEKYGIGTIIAAMLPYTIFFFLSWSVLLAIWMLLGLPTGPDAPIHL